MVIYFSEFFSQKITIFELSEFRSSCIESFLISFLILCRQRLRVFVVNLYLKGERRNNLHSCQSTFCASVLKEGTPTGSSVRLWKIESTPVYNWCVFCVHVVIVVASFEVLICMMLFFCTHIFLRIKLSLKQFINWGM